MQIHYNRLVGLRGQLAQLEEHSVYTRKVRGSRPLLPITPDAKLQLRKLLSRKRSRILYLDHVENSGRLPFEQIVRMNLEGMVRKRKNSPYRATEQPSP